MPPVAMSTLIGVTGHELMLSETLTRSTPRACLSSRSCLDWFEIERSASDSLLILARENFGEKLANISIT